MLPTFLRLLEIGKKHCIATEIGLRRFVVQFFIKPVWRKDME